MEAELLVRILGKRSIIQEIKKPCKSNQIKEYVTLYFSKSSIFLSFQSINCDFYQGKITLSARKNEGIRRSLEDALRFAIELDYFKQ